MAQVKFNKAVRSEIKAALEAKGVKVRETRGTIESSSLPETGVFTDFVVEDNPQGNAPIIRVVAVDAEGKEHKCALGRLSAFGIKKVTKDQTLSENDIVLRPTARGLRYQLNGRNLNGLPTAQDEAIAHLMGKKFKAVKKESFAIAYLPDSNFESKAQAIETAFVRDYYELSDIAEQ